jgi:uncharacterized protein YuzE
MAKETLREEALMEICKAVPHILKFPTAKMWTDYDKEADVFYISFKRPQRANDSEMLENGILLRYKDDELVGITILDASQR